MQKVFFSLFSYQVLLLFLLGALCEGRGLAFLGVCFARRKALNQAVEKQFLLNRCKGSLQLVEGVTDAHAKNALLEQLLLTLSALDDAEQVL